MGSARLPFALVVGPLLALALHFVALVSRAEQATPSSEPFSAFEEWLGAQRDADGRPCDRRAVQVATDYRVIACGTSGLWIARLAPDRSFVLVRTDDLGGPVVGLFVRDGRIWAEIARREARDVHPEEERAGSASFPGDPEPVHSSPAPAKASVAPSAPKAPRPAVAETPAPPEGRVTAVLLDEVVIDLGEQQGLQHSERIEFTVVTEIGVGGERAQQRRVVAVGVVRAVSKRFARVALGTNERVPLGALARPVDRPPSKSRVAPPRLGGVWHAGFMARPFVALDDLGGGVVIDASVGYRFETHLHLEASLSPLAWGTGEGTSAVTPGTGVGTSGGTSAVTPFAAFAKASYDPHLFEVGFGLGAETVYDTPFGTDSGTGALFVQQMRLGARDGLHLDTRSHVVLFHSRFAFSGFVGSAQIPVGDRFWLLFAGGGGSAGYGYGEIAVRALVRGNGDRGSFFFTGSMGGAGVFENQTTTCRTEVSTSPCPVEAQYVGPMIGAGGEWRF